MINSKDIKTLKIEEENQEHFFKIVDNTNNTWQTNRSQKEKISDSKIGKQAEAVFEKFVNIENNQYFYLSYDDFRTDNFKNHAPFDGLYINKDTSIQQIESIKNKINNIMKKNKYGKLHNLDFLRKDMRELGIFIVEIKSTRLKEDNKKNDKINFNKIKHHDFLSYPKFLRKTENKEFNENDYAEICKRKGINDINMEEKNNTADILVRIYIDEKKQEANLIGYITNKNFISNKVLKKMVQKNKSENALYWSVPIHKGTPISNLIKNKNIINLKNIKKIKQQYN